MTGPRVHFADPRYRIPLCGTTGWLQDARRDAPPAAVTCRACLRRLARGVLYLDRETGATVLVKYPAVTR